VITVNTPHPQRKFRGGDFSVGRVGVWFLLTPLTHSPPRSFFSLPFFVYKGRMRSFPGDSSLNEGSVFVGVVVF